MKQDWAAALQEAFQRKADVIPPGWKTVKEIAKEQGVSKEHVSRIVTRLVKMGRAEMKKFRTVVQATKTENVSRRSYFRLHPFYRLINGSSSQSQSTVRQSCKSFRAA